MSFKKLTIGAAAALTLVACGKSNDSPSHGAAAVSAPALDNNGNNLGTYSAGTPAYTFGVSSEALSYDGVSVNNVGQSTFLDPNVASEVSTLSAADRVIQTQQNTLEVWSQSNLLLAFDLSSGTPTMLQTGSSFQIASAAFMMSATDQKQGQGMNSGLLTLNIQDCAVEQKQDQGKVDQGQDQGKAPIDQGKSKFLTADVVGQGQNQGKDQNQGKAPIDQGKDQDQGKAPAPACHAVALSYQLMQAASPKQDQGKDQDQGKAPIDQGKGSQDQGKAPAPAPIDQGKGSQDQGKAPAPAPIDQGKGSQDQGKAPVPAPIDQGKGSQDQGKAPAPAPIDQGKGSQDQGKAPIDQGKK